MYFSSMASQRSLASCPNPALYCSSGAGCPASAGWGGDGGVGGLAAQGSLDRCTGLLLTAEES